MTFVILRCGDVSECVMRGRCSYLSLANIVDTRALLPGPDRKSSSESLPIQSRLSAKSTLDAVSASCIWSCFAANGRPCWKSDFICDVIAAVLLSSCSCDNATRSVDLPEGSPTLPVAEPVCSCKVKETAQIREWPADAACEGALTNAITR